MQNPIDYLNSLGLHRIKLGLQRISKLLQVFENPQDKLTNIIVGGTNGKGSVAAAIASILCVEGYKVGLYTSPHLIRVSERIKVNEEEIKMSDLGRLILEIKKVASLAMTEKPTYFEVLTGVAFLYFFEKMVDYVVLEVGMGGRFDATNVANAIVSVITNVYKDHTDFLGDTIGKIAFEKAGIIKYGVPIVTGARGKALDVIRSKAMEKSASIYVLGHDYISDYEHYDSFNYKGQIWNFENLHFSLKGLYQITNASLAIATLETMQRHYGVYVKENSIREGLCKTKWEGRMEIISYNPPLILDSAHNPSAACALICSLEKIFPGGKFVFLIGMLTGKDHNEFLKVLSCIAKSFIITDIPSERSVPSKTLGDIASNYLDNIRIISDYKKAFEEANKVSSNPICITGSLYLVGAIKKLMMDV